MSSPAAETSAVTPRKTMRGHTKSVRGIAHLPGGQHIITCSYDGSLRLWDLESGAQIGGEWRDEAWDEEEVRTLALSPNGKTIATGGSRDGTVKLWDVETGKVIAKWEWHTTYVQSVCWSPNGERVVSGSWDGTARVWDVKSGEPILGGLNPIKTGHKASVYAVSYSPKGRMIATGEYNENEIKIWDAKTGKLLSKIKLYLANVWSLTWTSDEKKIITGLGIGDSVRIFDTATWQQIADLKGHTQAVDSITLFRNDRLLASASRDGTARLWDLETNIQVGPPLQHERNVECAAFSADGKLLSTACDDHNAYVWDIHAILKAAGLEDILSIPNAPKVEPTQKLYTTSNSSSIGHISPSVLSQDIEYKSFLEADATRGFGQFEETGELPPGFFDDTQANAHSSATPGAHTKFSALIGRFPSLLHRSRPDQAIETQQPPGSSAFGVTFACVPQSPVLNTSLSAECWH